MNVGSQPIQLTSVPSGYTRTLVNVGGYTVYYGDRNVSAASNMGSVAAGASASIALPPAPYIVCPGGPGQVDDLWLPASVVAAAGGPPVAFQVVAPSGGDDTANLKAAAAAVVAAGQANGSNYGELWFDTTKGPFTLSGATDHTQSGNSQVPLPLIPSGTSTPKFTLVLRGVHAGALPQWNQTVGQKTGAVLRTTLTGTNDATFGPASVIGGPTRAQGYGFNAGNLWSNMLVIVDGVSIMSSTVNPTMEGFNFEGILQAKVKSASYLCDATPAAMAAVQSSMSNQWARGLAMPSNGNNDLSVIEDFSAEGVAYGAAVSEHCHVQNARSIYCLVGAKLSPGGAGSMDHFCRIDWWSIESCGTNIGVFDGAFKLAHGYFDFEGSTGPDIFDPNSYLIGEIWISANAVPRQANPGDRTAIINDANTSCVVHCQYNLPGAPSPQPAVPATTVAFRNLYGRDAIVPVAGGTVSQINVAGVNTGLTSGMMFVPNGQSITLTYTVAPTWNWILL